MVPLNVKMRSLLGVFLCICLSPLLVKCSSPDLSNDVLGLVMFKANIRDPYGKLSSWNGDDNSPCKWNGVKCDPRSNRVSELVLDGFGLSGRLGKGLLRLQFLRKLSLAKNNLTGSFSLGFSQLSNLRVLDLSENGLSGSIMSDVFSQCGALRSISVAKNKFSGTIPENLSSCLALALLNFSANQFSGPLPLETWSIPKLRTIDLSDNLLEGEIPAGIERLNNLSMISLTNNNFSGEVPNGIGNCHSLRSIDLSRNKLTGQLPDSLGKLQSLKILNVSRNALTGILPKAMSSCVNLVALDISHNSFTGYLPPWVFGLGLEQVLFLDNGLTGSLDDAFAFSNENSQQKLVILDLSQNKLSGAIPAAVGDFGSLQLLNMAKNLFVGAIPETIGRLNSLNVLDLSENQLNGSIHLSIGNCSSLKCLYLAHNEITGSVPASLANLSYLEIVDFSFNKLSGNLPNQLTNLIHIDSFNVSHNQLQGELPLGGFFNTIAPSSVFGNPSLCGAPLNRTCHTVLPKPIVLNPNSTNATPSAVYPSFGRGKKVLSISALIAIGAAVSIVIGVIAITVINLRVRASIVSRSSLALAFSGGDDDLSRSLSADGKNSGKLVMFSGDPDFNTGTQALLNKDCEVGRGGFGTVYRTVLGDGRSIAIKKLAVSSLVKSQEEFEREVKKLGKIHHVNLVALDGYYWTHSLQLLIYEFAPGGNLYKRLHETSSENYLSWNERFNIVLGTARGLAHLHQTNIIHYNLKSSNVLLDNSGEPKVADYGLARLLPTLDRYTLSSKIQSALGYMAPEYACKTVKITEKCDVYGFGVLVLEIVTGKRPVEYMEDDVVVLCDMIRGALEEGKVEECVDERLQGTFRVDEAIPVMKLGLICTSHVPSNRPDMAEVVNILELIRCPSESHDELVDFSPSY